MRSSSGREFSAAVLNGILPQNSHRGSIPAMAVNLLKQSLRVGREVDDVPGCSVEGGVPSQEKIANPRISKEEEHSHHVTTACDRCSGHQAVGYMALSACLQQTKNG